MTVTVSEIIEHFPKLLHLYRGDANTQLSRPCPPSAPEPGCILFLNDRRLIEKAVETDAVVGEGSHIHANVFIGHGTVIGRNCVIHPMASLGNDGFGYAHDEQFNHYRHVHYGRLVIEDDVHVGACVTIDRGHFVDSVIGYGTKIDNHCHLAHNVRVGRNCLMAGDFMTAGSVTIGNNNVFGGSARVTDHVTVGENMQFAGLAAVSKDIDEPGKAFGGHPLQPVNEYLKTCASVAHLPEIRKNLARVMRKLGIS
jgi:UDP-3-O-[3-hydroxymyristoyl] glucosamine N-acyltransferase